MPAVDVVDRRRRHRGTGRRLRAAAPRASTSRVLEAATAPAASSVTERFDGWVIDGGPDSLLVQKPAAVALCRELGLARSARLDRYSRAPRTSCATARLHPLAEGSFLGFPVSVGALVALVALHAGRQAAHGLRAVHAARRRRRCDESIALVRPAPLRRGGGRLSGRAAAAGIHAGDVDRLSMRALFPRLVEAERQAGSVIRAFRALQRHNPSPQGAFVSLPGGTGELVDALVARARAPATLGSPPSGAHRLAAAAGYTCLNRQRACCRRRAVIPGGRRPMRPAPAARLDTRWPGCCERFPYASTATVAFGYRRDQVAHPMRGTGFVVPRVERPACSPPPWVTSKWPGRAPTATCCCAASSAAAAIRTGSTARTTS